METRGSGSISIWRGWSRSHEKICSDLSKENYFKKAILIGVALLCLLSYAGYAEAQTEPTLASVSFFGGAGDQRGTGISISSGAIYISGNVEPGNQNSADTALVLKYAIPPGPSTLWSKSFGFGTNFFGAAATGEGVYASGWNYSLTPDGVGGKEIKSFVAKFAPDGSSGPGTGGSTWIATPNFFSYRGYERHEAVSAITEGGLSYIYAAGLGEPCGSRAAYILAKYDTTGNLLAKATDSSVGINFNSCFTPSAGSSNGAALTGLNGSIYASGHTAWSSEGDNPNSRPAIWKYDQNLNLI